MASRKLGALLVLVGLALIAARPANAQSFQVQCPTSTITHPTAANSEPAYTGATTFATGAGGYLTPASHVNGAIKCQQISGGDGFATMGDGTQTYLFAFGPLSGLQDMANGLPGTEFPSVVNVPYGGTFKPGDPATADGASSIGPNPLSGFGYNGAVGLAPDRDCLADPTCAATIPASGINGHVDTRPIMDVGVMNGNIPAALIVIDEDDEFFLTLTNVGQVMRPDLFEQHTVHFHGYPNASAFYDGVPDASVAINIGGSATYYYVAPDAGTYFWHCHITPPEHLQMGMVGQLYVRPRQNREPAGTSLYYADAGSAPPGSSGFGTATGPGMQSDLRTACQGTGTAPAAGYTYSTTAGSIDILCSAPIPLPNTATQVAGAKYAYDDGDGSTRYDIDVPIQIHGFDPNFHFVGMTFNPEGFSDMKDKYFLLNGRSYPDTITRGAITTQASDGLPRPSQPMTSLITLSLSGGPGGTPQRAALRIADLDVAEYQTLASIGMPMQLVGYNAKILRDQAGNNLYYTTNSITLGGGESLDVILDSCAVRGPAPTYTCTTPMPTGTYFLYTPNLDHLANDAENFGGLMTEVVVTP